MPRIVKLDANAPENAAIAEAASVLRGGGLVAFPTETVYGLGARGLHAGDVAKIFVAKGRPSAHPLILHVDGEAMARSIASTWSENASRFARAFWPGPLTLVVPRAAHVPREVSGGLLTVAVRSPSHAVARALIAAVGEPLAAPSANAHTAISPTTAAHVVASLGDRVDVVLDAGPCAHGIESTVLDLTGDRPRVLRPGAASLDDLRAIDPDVIYEAIDAADTAPRASPGLASKHYAPRAEVVIVSAIPADAVAAIVWSEHAKSTAAGAVFALPADPIGYGALLYATLHAVDAAGYSSVAIEAVPEDSAWWAIADRLRRASTRT